jgi:hypothetical protein
MGILARPRAPLPSIGREAAISGRPFLGRTSRRAGMPNLRREAPHILSGHGGSFLCGNRRA